MSIVLNGSTGITTPDIDSIAGFDAPDLTGALPAIDGSALTALTAANLTGALPAIDGAALTGIQTGPTYATKVATTSGTAFDFTGIPAGVKEIKVFFDDVGLTTNENFRVLLGTSSGFVSTGYVGSSFNVSASVVYELHSSTGFLIRSDSLLAPVSGVMTITRSTESGNVWHQAQSFGGPVQTIMGAGVVDAGAELTQIRLIPNGGSPTFNSGTLNISWSF
jgi:hypothetical protein